LALLEMARTEEFAGMLFRCSEPIKQFWFPKETFSEQVWK